MPDTLMRITTSNKELLNEIHAQLGDDSLKVGKIREVKASSDLNLDIVGIAEAAHEVLIFVSQVGAALKVFDWIEARMQNVDKQTKATLKLGDKDITLDAKTDWEQSRAKVEQWAKEVDPD